jgi:hypothetical protein
MVENARAFIDRLAGYEHATYLSNMSSLLSIVDPSSPDIEIIKGNLKLTSSSENGKIFIMHTENGVDFSPKSFSLQYENGHLTKLVDGYFLFTVGSTAVNITPDKAQTIAKEALGGYSWVANGTSVNDFTTLPNPTIYFHPNTKNGLELYPQYTVTFQLNKIYPAASTA